MSNSGRNSVGDSMLGLLQVCLIVMKLAEVGVVAQWSWWLVMSPMLVSVAIVLLVVAVVLVAEARR